VEATKRNENLKTIALRRKTSGSRYGPGFKKRLWRYRSLYVMLLPALLTIAVFNYGPMYGIVIAFKELWISKGIMGSPWVGFDNFEKLFALQKFWQVLRNSVEISLLRLMAEFPAPIILALLLNEVRRTFMKRTIQTIVYLPHFISWVTISGIMFAMLSDDGLVNAIVAFFGGNKVQFLSQNGLFRPILIMSSIWKEIGWGTIIFLAAIAGISPEMYEAAKVDGANRLQQMLHITLPSLAPVITMLLILNVGSLMSGGGFDQVYNLYNPLVYDSGDIIDTYVFRVGITEGKYSMGTAVGLFLNVINLILLVVANSIAKRVNGQNIY